MTMRNQNRVIGVMLGGLLMLGIAATSFSSWRSVEYKLREEHQQRMVEYLVVKAADVGLDAPRQKRFAQYLAQKDNPQKPSQLILLINGQIKDHIEAKIGPPKESDAWRAAYKQENAPHQRYYQISRLHQDTLPLGLWEASHLRELYREAAELIELEMKKQ
jgi:hypothetical protein